MAEAAGYSVHCIDN